MAKRNNTVMWVFISIILMLIGASGLLFLNNYLQTERQLKLEQQKQALERKVKEEAENAKMFKDTLEEACLDQAFKVYKKNWSEESKSLGRTDGKLPYELIEVHDERYREAKEDCKQ